MRSLDGVHLADLRRVTGQPALHDFIEDTRPRLVDFEEHRGVDVDADQHESRVVGCAVPRIPSSGNHAFQSGA